ncbi:MAG: replication factor C small subunit [Thermoplasmatota archaeon]
MDEIWVEKYRPRSLDDVVGQPEVVRRLKSYVETGNLPHLLFAGPPGTGKTTCAVALARGLFGEDWKGKFLELNASDERGINVVRTKIKEFARVADIGRASFKIIFLDEADALTSDAQAALRRTMEMFAGNVRFILSCNYSSKIIEPIQSRCALFRMRPLKADDVKIFVGKVAKAENVTVSQDGMEALLHVAQGDMRRAVNTLQVAAAAGPKVTEETVFAASAQARPEEVKEMLEVALSGNFLKARDMLDELLITYGLSGEDVVRQIHRLVFDLPVPDEIKVELVDRVGETDYRLVEGANERIQVEALLAAFSLKGKGIVKARK